MTELAVSDARYVSRYSQQTTGVVIVRDEAPADADANDVDVTVRRIDTDPPQVVATGSASRTAVGTYAYTITPSVTDTVGRYSVTFAYTLDGDPDSYVLHFNVGEASPNYDALDADYKALVESVWVRLADLWDFPYGGPHLQSYVQTKFNRERIAQLLRIALSTLNIYTAPYASYGIPEPAFPFPAWGGLLEKMLWIEVVKHLRRSYLEQPEVTTGVSVARFDRSVYFERWGAILEEERADLDLMLDNYKMAHMGLGNVSVLVSGGAYGNWGPFADAGGAGEAAARGYWFVRRRW